MNGPVTCLIGAGRSGLPMCSLQCLGAYLAKYPSIKVQLAQSTGRALLCVHCYVCGVIIRRPTSCRLHDAPCPETRWDMTERAGEILYLVRTIARHHIESEVEAMAMLQDVLNPGLTVQQVAQQTINKAKEAGLVD